jgi:hypothetical protein
MTPATVIDNVFIRQFQEGSLFCWTGDKNELFDHDAWLLMLKNIKLFPTITIAEDNRDINDVTVNELWNESWESVFDSHNVNSSSTFLRMLETKSTPFKLT